MYKSKNCGHGFDLYVKMPKICKSLTMPLTREGELKDLLADLTGETYFIYIPTYCPICGKKVEEV